MLKIAKRFTVDGCLAVRLPEEFRFRGDTVNIRRDPVSGDVVLSSRAQADWRSFMTLRSRLQTVPDDFLQRSPLGEQRDPLAQRRKK
jgi:antitoxin VapB